MLQHDKVLWFKALIKIRYIFPQYSVIHYGIIFESDKKVLKSEVFLRKSFVPAKIIFINVGCQKLSSFKTELL